MKYLGSKNRIAKHILPIMLEVAESRNIKNWFEPFVGGGNMIDKVPSSFNRFGTDLNEHAIQALIGIRDMVDELPKVVTEDYYKSIMGKKPNPITSLIRFGASFGGKFEGGYARGFNNNGKPRNYWEETFRNAQKQSSKLQNVKLKCSGYEDFSHVKNCLIYCDPPYEGTTSYKTGNFDHPKFWQWCRDMSKNNIVFISEYSAPDDFECVWQGEVKTNFASQRKGSTHNAVEKLFKLDRI